MAQSSGVSGPAATRNLLLSPVPLSIHCHAQPNHHPAPAGHHRTRGWRMPAALVPAAPADRFFRPLGQPGGAIHFRVDRLAGPAPAAHRTTRWPLGQCQLGGRLLARAVPVRVVVVAGWCAGQPGVVAPDGVAWFSPIGVVLRQRPGYCLCSVVLGAARPFTNGGPGVPTGGTVAGAHQARVAPARRH